MYGQGPVSSLGHDSDKMNFRSLFLSFSTYPSLSVRDPLTLSLYFSAQEPKKNGTNLFGSECVNAAKIWRIDPEVEHLLGPSQEISALTILHRKKRQSMMVD